MTNSGLGRARSGARGGNALIRHGRYAGALVALAAVVSGAGSCADLIDIDHDVCGNQILDPGEDCDGHDDTSGSPCAAPGEPASETPPRQGTYPHLTNPNSPSVPMTGSPFSRRQCWRFAPRLDHN